MSGLPEDREVSVGDDRRRVHRYDERFERRHRAIHRVADGLHHDLGVAVGGQLAIFGDANEVGGRQRQATGRIIFVINPRFVLRPEGAGQHQATRGPWDPRGFEAAVVGIVCHRAAQIVWTEQQARHGIVWGREPIGLPLPQERERHIDGVIQPGLAATCACVAISWFREMAISVRPLTVSAAVLALMITSKSRTPIKAMPCSG